MGSSAGNSRRLGKRFSLAEALLAVALLSGWALWPAIRTGWGNPWPQVLTLEEFRAHGSIGEWVTLKDCYVDVNGSVEDLPGGGRETYFPIRSGPNDDRPVKVFVKPSCWSAGADQVWLAREGEGPGDVAGRAAAGHGSELQEVSGLVAVGWKFSGGTRDLIRSERSHGAPDAILLLHNQRPPNRVEGLAALAVPLGSAGLSLFLFFRRRRKPAAGPNAPPPPPRTARPPQGVSGRDAEAREAEGRDSGADRATSEGTHKADRPAHRMIVRAVLLAACAVLLLLTATGFGDRYVSVTLPAHVSTIYNGNVAGIPVESYVHRPSETLLHKSNGLSLAMGLFSAGLLLICLNAAFRSRKRAGAGPLDLLLLRAPAVVFACLVAGLAALLSKPLIDAFSRAIDHVGESATGGLLISHPVTFIPPWPLLICAVAAVGWGIQRSARNGVALPMGVLVLCIAAFVYQAKDVRYHADADDAVAAFEADAVHVFQNAGGFLFGTGLHNDQITHIAAITPELVRALDRKARNVYTLKPTEVPLPGWLPLVLLLGIAIAGLAGRGGGWTAALFGLLNLYMVWWSVAVTHGVMPPPDDVPETRIDAFEFSFKLVCLVAAAVPFTWIVCGRLQDAARAERPALSARWASIYYLVQSGAIGGIFLVSQRTAGTPVGLWLLAYLALGSLCWMASVRAAGPVRQGNRP
ncbi:MAG TPA: hypothetical protein VGI81_16185 [Tepidisphaeraceae bacterium]|jgi:hypothetical protein